MMVVYHQQYVQGSCPEEVQPSVEDVVCTDVLLLGVQMFS